MVIISGFTQTTNNPFVLFTTNGKTYFNGLTASGSADNYYYNQGNVYVFHRIGDFSDASGNITINPGSSVTAYLVGGGGNGNSTLGGGGGGYYKATFTTTASSYYNNISIGGSATVTTFGSYTAAAGTNASGSNKGKKFVDNSLGYTYFYGGGGGNGGYGGNGYNSLGAAYTTISGGAIGGGGGGYNHAGGIGGGGGGYSSTGNANGGSGGGPNGGAAGGGNATGSGGGGGGNNNGNGGNGGLLGGGGGGVNPNYIGGNGGAGGGGACASIGGNGGPGGGGGGGGGIGGYGGPGGGGGGGANGVGGVGLLVLVIVEAPPPPCFLYDSKILTNKGYRPIQDLRKGDLVKTLKHYYKSIDMIGKRDMNHPASQERIKNQLYKCSKEQYPELNEDLIITGCHAILVDSFNT